MRCVAREIRWSTFSLGAPVQMGVARIAQAGFEASVGSRFCKAETRPPATASMWRSALSAREARYLRSY